MSNEKSWPVLRRYRGRRLERVALPLGGIGTGSISLGGRGQLQDWEVVNRPAKGFTPNPAFFALRVRAPGEEPQARILEGPIPFHEYEGPSGSRAAAAGMPRFTDAVFETAYPMAQVTLEDQDLPVTVRLEAFNPVVPCDLDASGLPVAILRYVVVSRAVAPRWELTGPQSESTRVLPLEQVSASRTERAPFLRIDQVEVATPNLAYRAPAVILDKRFRWDRSLLDILQDLTIGRPAVAHLRILPSGAVGHQPLDRDAVDVDRRRCRSESTTVAATQSVRNGAAMPVAPV